MLPACRVLLFAILATGCASAPRWYAGHRTTWEVALVDPQAPGLVVEAHVQGRGPYRFLLDPDAPASVIDDGVARQLGLYSNQHYVRVVNQRDTSLPRKVYEVLSLDAGELQVRNVGMLNAPAGTLAANGKRIDGILGSDLLSRTIVMHVDRDHGRVTLALTGNQTIPPQAVAVRGWLHDGAVFVPARLGDGRDVTLQVRVASGVSTLSHDVYQALDAPRIRATAVAVDETGTGVRIPGAVVVPTLGLDGLEIANVPFFGHVDQRIKYETRHDGTLGEDVLSRFEYVLDRDRAILWLAPRTHQGPPGAGAVPVRLAASP